MKGCLDLFVHVSIYFFIFVLGGRGLVGSKRKQNKKLNIPLDNGVIS